MAISVSVLSAVTRRALPRRRHIASVEAREFVTADKSRRVRACEARIRRAFHS